MPLAYFVSCLGWAVITNHSGPLWTGRKMSEPETRWTPKSNPNKTPTIILLRKKGVCLKLKDNTEQSCSLLLLLLLLPSAFQASRSPSPSHAIAFLYSNFHRRYWQLGFCRWICHFCFFFWYDSDFSVFVQNLAGFLQLNRKMFLTRWSSAFSFTAFSFSLCFCCLILRILFLCLWSWFFLGLSMIGVWIPSLLKVDCSRLSTRLRLLR